MITGSPSEQGLAESIRDKVSSECSPVVAAGSLPSLGQTAACVERAAAVVTGDTSVLHLASALGTPLVGIYGSTRPRDNAPRFGRNRLLFNDEIDCSPCYKAKCPLHGSSHMACMTSISPDAVLNALTELQSGDKQTHSRARRLEAQQHRT